VCVGNGWATVAWKFGGVASYHWNGQYRLPGCKVTSYRR